MNGQSTKNRYRVTGLLVLLFAITYLGRVCISLAGPRIREDLHIDPIGWGWVTGIFALSYCLFEIPTGAMAARIGPWARVDPDRAVVIRFYRAHGRDDQLLSPAPGEIFLRCRRSGRVSQRL